LVGALGVVLILVGCKNESAAADKAQAPKCATCVVADEKGFTPSSLELKAGAKGETAELTFTRTSEDTCARDIVFPELSIKEPLPMNKPVKVRVPVDAARTLTFQCGMGMYKSSVVIR
jgi:plastocyanin domain-containing protein